MQRQASNRRQQGFQVRQNVASNIHGNMGNSYSPTMTAILTVIVLVQATAVTVVLAYTWNGNCDKPLKLWVLLFAARSLVVTGMHIYLCYNRRRLDADGPVFIKKMISLLDTFGVLWFIFGNVWFFGSSFDNCEPMLYKLCMALLIISYVSISLPFIIIALVIACIPCLPCIILLLQYCGQRSGASEEIIRKLEVKKFTRGLVPEEDCSCPICFSDYEENEELRFLPCRHHFHSNCVDTWLKTNPTCPICRYDIVAGHPATVENV